MRDYAGSNSGRGISSLGGWVLVLLFVVMLAVVFLAVGALFLSRALSSPDDDLPPVPTTVVPAGVPTIEATATSSLPTLIPTATAAVSTNTPPPTVPLQPTNTLEPTPTRFIPTITPRPTNTPIPPTATPRPILPTNTPVPILPTSTFVPTPTVSPNVWRGEYFANRDLAGTPVIRSDANIAFNWGAGSPMTGIPADNFSVRWTRLVNFPSGTYTFNAFSDDGVRVWINDELIIDAWTNASNQIHTTTRSLGGGNYQLRVEYFENIGDAGIAFWWEQGFAYPQWRGDYYTNRNLSGNPAVTRNDVDINFDWGTGSPAGGIPADNFSVRWTRTLNFNAGTYTFHVRMNDGARVYIDGNLVIDDWREAPLRELTADVPLTTGLHTIVVEYFEGVNTASVQFWWDQPGVFAQWRGDYFTNRNLAGNPAVTRNDTEINFNWGTGSPASGIPADNFSVRWTRTLNFNAGTYRFHVRMNDGARVYVDNNLIINDWVESPLRERTADISLSAGSHTIIVEYFEGINQAVVEFWWEQIN